jgi:hypothetical protein
MLFIHRQFALRRDKCFVANDVFLLHITVDLELSVGWVCLICEIAWACRWPTLRGGRQVFRKQPYH